MNPAPNPPDPAPGGNTGEPLQKISSRWRVAANLGVLALAGLLLYLALKDVDWRSFAQILRQGNYVLLPVLFTWSSTVYFLRAVRWRVMLSAERKLPISSVFWANMAGYLGNSFLPARAGELIRSIGLGRREQLSSSFILAAALTERLIDLIALTLIASASLAAMPVISPGMSTALRGLILLGCGGLAFLILAPRLQPYISKSFDGLKLPANWKTRLENLISRFLDGMRSLNNPRRAAWFGLLTAVIWLGEGLGTVLGGRMLNLDLTLTQGLVLVAALGISSAVPSTPGYVGMYQFAAVSVLVPFGFSRSEALAYILVAQVMNYIVVTAWGLPGLMLTRKSSA